MSVVGRPSEWRRQSPTQIFRRGLRGSKGSSSSSATSDVRDAFTSQGLKAYLVYWRQEINSGFECKRFLCSHTGNWYYRSLRLLGLHWPLLRFEASVELIQSIDGRRRRTAVFIVKASAEEEATRASLVEEISAGDSLRDDSAFLLLLDPALRRDRNRG